MEITAAMVKKLRDATGAGMMECKAALTEANGDIDAATTLLRKRGPRPGREEGRALDLRGARSATTSTWAARSACSSR